MSEPTTPSTERSLADAGAVASTWSWNVVTGEVTWSKGIEEALFGLPEGSFGGTFEAYFALVHPDDRAYFQAVIARTLASENEYVMSHRVVWADGSVHWIDGRGLLTRDAEGRPLVLTGLAWTTTARALAEARLTHLRRVEAVASAVHKKLLRVQSDEEAFAHACQIAVDHGHFRFAWIGLVSPDSPRVRPAARAGFEDGYLDEAVITVDSAPTGLGPAGRSIREGRPVVANDIGRDEAFLPWREAALRRGYRGCAAFPLRRGGAVVGALAIYAAEESRFERDQIDLLSDLAEDIGVKLDALHADGRRRAAEEAMRHSEERYRALVEQAADAIFLADPDDTLLEVNTTACEMTGYAREELIGHKIGELLFEPVDRERRVVLGHAPGSRVSGERRLRRKDGTKIDAEVTAIVLADGRIQGYTRDITQRKILQAKLIVSDRLASLGRLAAGVAHEVNNPLAYLALNLERIERAASEVVPAPDALTEIRAAAADAREGAERVRAVVRALGALGRQDEEVVGAVDLHRVLDGAVRLSESKVRHRGRITKDYQATCRVRGNELRLGQVFVNLLVNAADALRDGALEKNEIIVRTLDAGQHVVVEIHDNGAGIGPDVIGRIFDPFFTTKEVGEGTGLGLAITRGIVDSFGGHVGVESAPGAGTTFRVSLVAEPPAPSPAENTGPHAVAGPVAARVRLLIVDDEPRLARVLAATLDHHAVTIATSGREALLLCQRHAYDCVLCDLMMPDLSGIDLHAELARAGLGQERRMIFMTGGTFTARSRDFVRAIPNAVIEKPFTAGKVDVAIAEILAREGVSGA